MSPRFGDRSMTALGTAHPDLRRLFAEVVKHFDCAVLEGHRDEETQNRMLTEGKSQLPWPRSKHNRFPALAVDVVPYPIDWSDKERFVLFGGFVLGIASQMGIKMRWGGDWSMGYDVKDERFRDYPHFELVDE